MKILFILPLIVSLLAGPSHATKLTFDTTGWTNQEKNAMVRSTVALCKKAGFDVMVKEDVDGVIVEEPIPSGLILSLVVTPQKLKDEIDADIAKIITDGTQRELDMQAKEVAIRKKLGNLTQEEFDDFIEVISWKKGL